MMWGKGKLIVALNSLLRMRLPPIWIVGDGRSGTTWLADVINFRSDRRIIFEPLHPGYVQSAEAFGYFPYFKDEFDINLLSMFYDDVFRGRFYHWRTDQQTNIRFYKGILVKDIHAHFILGDMVERFPDIKPVFLVRNPIDVVHSKLSQASWQWYCDYKSLAEKVGYSYPEIREIVNSISRPNLFEQYVLIWCITNYVALNVAENSNGRVKVCFYEELVSDLSNQLPDVFHHIGDTLTDCDLLRLSARAAIPSRVTRKQRKCSDYSSGRSQAYALVSKFGLTDIFERSEMARR